MDTIREGVQPFVYEALPGRVVFSPGMAAERLHSEIEGLGASRVLLLVTEQERELAERLAKPLGGWVAGIFTGIRPHVPVEVAREATEEARRVDADCLVCFGGGSTTGAAKAIALETGLPIVAVPTTYAGSEMTPVYGLTEGNRKTTGKSMSVLPKVVVYDPELTFSLPDFVTGPSAINALAHCVEAFYASGANPISSLMAEEGIRAIADGLPDAVLNPEGLSGRSKTLYGAYLAGAAFASAGGGIHHKICHVLGGAYDLPHAETHTIVLPHATALNRNAIPQAMARIARALGRDDAAEGLYEFATEVGTPVALKDIGMREEDLEEATGLCTEVVPEDNPAKVGEAEIRQLLKDAHEGNRPAK
jgi:alcohol dehydrogenase class IV